MVEPLRCWLSSPRGGNEAAGIYRASRWRGDVAAGCAGAAARADAAHRRSYGRSRRRSRRPSPHCGVPGGTAAIGLDTTPAMRKSTIRWSAGCDDTRRRHAAELIALAPDIILASGGSVVGALLQATRTVPIVFAHDPDPVGAGFVDSLARPGGNATGFTLFEYGISAKWLELLKEIAPGVTRAAVLRDAAIPAGTGQFAAIQSVGAVIRGGVKSGRRARRRARSSAPSRRFARSAEWRTDRDGERTLAMVHRDLIITLAARHRLPAVYFARYFVAGGGLISYGPDVDRPVPARSRATSIASSRARSLPICQCRQSTKVRADRSISRPPRRSASTCRRRCSPAPTR